MNRNVNLGLSPAVLLMMLLGLLLVMSVASGLVVKSIVTLSMLTGRDALISASVIQNIVAFFIPAFIVGMLSGDGAWNFNRVTYVPDWRPFVGAVLVYLISLPMMNQVIYWNSELQLPESMRGLEQTLRGWEDKNVEATTVLLSGSSVAVLISGLLSIGMLTGFCEEIFFRGSLQTILGKITGSATTAIIISAVIFSTMHFQFYGFVPRTLMGLFFGYLLVATRSLWTSAFAHCLNNSIIVLIYWLKNHDIDMMWVERFGVEKEIFPWPCIVSTAALILFFIFFRRYFFHPPQQPGTSTSEEEATLYTTKNSDQCL